MMKKALLVWFALLVSGNLFGAAFVVSGPGHVEDCILRQSDLTYHDETYWTGWNFGASQTLDTGYAIAMWNQWRGNILIRFDMCGVDCKEAKSAKLRIYKPRNVTQTSGEVPVALYRVKDANCDWKEGDMESMPQYDAASWQYRGNGIQWAGGGGCSVPGTDYADQPLGRAMASKYRGEWLEFDIPASLVQSWIDDPAHNAGLLLKTDEKEEVLGDHVLFYSTEHSSGKGPRLVVEGTRGKARFAADPAKKFNPRYEMPRPTQQEMDKYLHSRNFRSAQWTTDPTVNLQGEQKIYPYYWDIVVYGEYVLPYSYYPFSQSILGLDSMIARGDREGLRQFQINRLRYLHLWEYIREQRWYDCGDIIEFLSPLQAAYIWLGSKKDNGLTFDGILEKIHPKGTKDLSQEEIQVRRAEEVMECAKNLYLTEEQYDSVARFISEMENLRCIWYNKCNQAAQQVHRLMAEKNDGNEMIDALGAFMNYHDVYLFYDSYWQMKRWAFLMDHTDMVALNRFWKKQKYNEYSPVRIEERFRTCAEFYPENRGPLPIIAKNVLH